MYMLSLQYYLLSFVFFLGIKLFPLRTILRWQKLEAGENSSGTSENYMEEARLIRRLIRRIRKYAFWRFKCLEQSLLVMHYCRKRKIPATLYLGAKKEAEHLKAHAWVVIGEDVSFDTHNKGTYKTLGVYCF